MPVERHPRPLAGLSDDALGTIAVSLVVSEVSWTPDVAPAVIDRLSRDAVAYPEQFDRRPAPERGPALAGRPERRGRPSVRRVLVLALLVALASLAVYLLTREADPVATGAAPGGLAVTLEPLARGLDGPVFVTSAGDDSGELYAVEQSGRIRLIAPDGSVREEPFLDLRDAVVTSYEQGLLGLAFHPDHRENGRLYVDYTRAADGATVISELEVRDGVADRSSERELLVIEQPFANHNGGMLAFDADGYLLIGVGDGGGGGDPLGSGQDPSTLLGKLLRIDVDAGEPYAIPPGNAFADDEGYRPEIHALGLRNPWRFSVDREGGHIYIGDVGQNAWEEIDVMPDGTGGLDFGWNEMEGPECFRAGCDPSAHVAPAIAYRRDAGCTIVGGYPYRGSQQPALEGRYVFGDYCSGTIWSAPIHDLLAGAAEATVVGRMEGTLVSFGVDDAGEIYAVDQDGRILRVIGEAA